MAIQSLLREEALFGLDVGGEQPGLAGGDDGVIAAGVAPAVGDEEAAVLVVAGDAGDARPRAAAMERIERGAASANAPCSRATSSRAAAAAARRRRRPGAGGCPGRCRRRAGSPAWSWGNRCPSRRCRSRPGRRSRGGGSCGARRPRRWRRSRRRCARPRSGSGHSRSPCTRAASRSRMASCMAENCAPCSRASFQACLDLAEDRAAGPPASRHRSVSPSRSMTVEGVAGDSGLGNGLVSRPARPR